MVGQQMQSEESRNKREVKKIKEERKRRDV